MTQATKKNIAPAITLLFLSPLIIEILPGATRFSSIFVFPIEMVVWGGGALLIRYVVRKSKAAWINMLLLALALSLAEEFLIQQTSVAPMVIRLKGITYARAGGINYVYLLWALIYEPVFAVLLPVFLTELIFPKGAKDLWINKGGVILFSILFLLGSFAAWFTWTQIARVKVFHLPEYKPTFLLLAIAIILILFLIFMGTRHLKKTFPVIQKIKLPKPWVLVMSGVLWATLLFGLVLLGFGITPSFPPIVAVVAGLGLAIVAISFLPSWKKDPRWKRLHTFSIIFGVMLGSMLISFIGFIGAAPADLYFKIIIDVIAITFLIALGLKIKKQSKHEVLNTYFDPLTEEKKIHV